MVTAGSLTITAAITTVVAARRATLEIFVLLLDIR
jgi:hypothetical protein